VLGAVGLAVYGSVRFADTAFYARLGTTPDSVGISYAETLSRVAGPVALLTGVIVTLFMLARINWFLGIIFSAPAAMILGILLPLPHLAGTSLIAFAIIMAIIIIGVWWEARTTANRAREMTPEQPVEPTVGPPLVPRSFWVAGGILLLIIFGLSGLIGYRQANYLINGDPALGKNPLPCGCSKFFGYNVELPWTSGSEGFLGIEATPVKVRWIGPGPTPGDLPTEAYFLGESDGVDVVFDPGANQSVSIPVNSVVLTSRNDLTPFKE
jgi:hypothetical protein